MPSSEIIRIERPVNSISIIIQQEGVTAVHIQVGQKPRCVVRGEHWAGPDELMGQAGSYGPNEPSAQKRQREHWAGPDELMGR